MLKVGMCERGLWSGSVNILLLSPGCGFSFVPLHNLCNSRTDNQEDLSCLAALFSWERREICAGL